MKSYFIILIFLFNFSVLLKYCNSQVSSGQLYDVNINNIVYDQYGSESYNINYYPTRTNTNYTGEKFYSLDKSRIKAAKVTLTNDCILNGDTASITDCTYTINSKNHTIIATQQIVNDNTAHWDRNDIPSILSIDGNVTIRGSDSSSTWTGYDSTNRTTFVRSFPFTNDGMPIIKLVGTRDVYGTENYKLHNYYTSEDVGFILINPYNKNVWIRGIGKCSMVFTGSSTVDIKNSVLYDFGHTTSSPLDESNNIPNRYPITLYHNKKSVNIENNCFLAAIHSGTPQQSLTPRSFIGAIRSFGNIIGNSFLLKASSDVLSMSGISLLYDNIDYINSGIISTSPYSFYESNIFEGIYNGNEQSNLNDISNSNWNKVIFKDNIFFGETEFRVTYSMSLQPPIKINFLRPSVTLPPNEANVDYSYDSSLVQFHLYTWRRTFGETNNLKDFFSDSFKCNYISIVDSKFTHMIHVGNSTTTFIKRFANQVHLSNVNGTRIHGLSGIFASLFPFYQLSPMSIINPPLTQNGINFTFIPNFDSPIINRAQILETIIDEEFQNNTIIDPLDNPIHSKFVQFSQNANGPYTVVLSTKLLLSNATGYEIYAVGSYFAGTYIVDNSANSFYLGIDLSPPPPPIVGDEPPRALSIFGNQLTKCNWIQSLNKCTTTGSFTPNSSMIGTPSEITEIDEISMITSYLGNDITNNIPSTLNISLADWTDSIVNPIPSFSIKINDKYQEPITRLAPTYLTYKKYGPFYWNNLNSNEEILSIKWANENIKYSIPL
ncbi:hypothetical protein ACTFIY_006135 [Dictyostelium cf. discoideum]